MDKYVDEQEAVDGASKRYARRKFVANESGDRIVVWAYVSDDGEVLNRDGVRPTVTVIRRELNLATMKLE